MSAKAGERLPTSAAATAAVGDFQASDSCVPDAAAAAAAAAAVEGARRKSHVIRDIDGREIRDDREAVDLKFILAHTPNVDDEEDDTGGSTAATHGAGGGGSVSEVVTATTSALIESQFQPVDEDDIEYGENSDQDNVDETELAAAAAASGRRERRSSLKHILRSPSTDAPPHDFDSSRGLSSPGGGSSSGRSSPGSASMHERKSVRFVDGPGLEELRELVSSDEPPEVPASALKDLKIRRRKRSRSILTWVLDFEQPGSDPEFISRVLKEKVALENCIAPTDRDQRMTISGTVRVANVAYDKHVEVRWTIDGWLADGQGTYREAAGYMPGSSDGGTDRFAFLICPPHVAMEALHRQLQSASSSSSSSSSAPRLEFVVSYEAGGVTYWDNNAGRNYGVVVSAVSSPVSTGFGEQQQQQQHQ